MSGIAQVTDVANAFSTTLTAGISATDTTITVDSTGDLTAPCYLIIEPLSGTKREVVLCDSNVTATTFVLSGVSKRGLDAPAVSHLAGAKVISGPVAQHIDDLNARVDDVDRHLTVGATEPPTPQTGDLWVDTTAVGGTYTGDFDFTGDVDIQGTLGNVAAVSGDIPSHDGTSFKPKSLAELDLLTETAANGAYAPISGSSNYVKTTGNETVAGVKTFSSPPYVGGVRVRKRLGLNYIVCLGDSITFGYDGSGGTEVPTPWPTALTWLNPNIKTVNSGVSGDRLEDAYARLQTAVLNYAPSHVHVALGTNNLAQGDTLSNMKTQAALIADALMDNGIHVAFHSLLPRSDFSADAMDKLRRYNRWLSTVLCRDRGMQFIDIYSTFSDASGAPVTGYLSDGRHPSAKGYWEYAKAVNAAVRIVGNDLPYVMEGEDNLFPDPEHTGGDTAGVDNDLTYTKAASVTGTASIVARGDGFGNWQQSSRSGGASGDSDYFLSANYQLSTLGISPSDTIEYACDLDTDGDLGGARLRFRVQAHSGAGATGFLGENWVDNIYAPVEGARIRGTYVLPATAAYVRLIWNCYGVGTAVWRFGRVTLRRVET